MKIPEALISEIEIEIEKKKLELKELESTLNVLVKLGRAPSSSYKATQVTTPLFIDNETISIDDLNIVDNSSKETFKDQVKSMVSKLGDQEFTVKHVDAILKKYGVTVNGKAPRSRISIILNKLVEENLLSRTFTGVGNVPNKYKLLNYDHEL